MKLETTGQDLLAAVEQTLVREVAPALSGGTRFKVLMAASALRMVMREWSQAPELADAAARLGDSAALVDAIRSASHDGDQTLHGLLLADALARTRVANPAQAAASGQCGRASTSAFKPVS